MPKNKKWTVVGFYEDNMQPIVLHETAPTPMAAAHAGSGRVDSPIRVVEVFAGHQMGELGNDEVL